MKNYLAERKINSYSMKAEHVKSVKLEFEGDEVDTIKNIISKVNDEATKTGFQKLFEKDEVTLIMQVNEKLKTA